MDRRTRKLMTMHKASHPSDDIDRLYESRKKGGRGLAYTEDTVDTSIQLEDNIEKHWGRLITGTRNNTANMWTNWIEITRKQKWKEKQLYGRFKQLTSDISHKKTWMWLRKRKTESLLIAAQKNAIRTKYIKARIDKM